MIIRFARRFVFAVLALVAGIASACQCGYVPLENETAQKARHIFVFQLLSADIGDGKDVRELTVAARIRIVDEIAGRSHFKRMHYWTSDCCGTRLDVGRYYVAFLENDGDVFDGNPGNLMEVGVTYDAKSDVGEKLRAVSAQKQTLEQAFGEYPGDRLERVRAPPSPCGK